MTMGKGKVDVIVGGAKQMRDGKVKPMIRTYDLVSDWAIKLEAKVSAGGRGRVGQPMLFTLVDLLLRISGCFIYMTNSRFFML